MHTLPSGLQRFLSPCGAHTRRGSGQKGFRWTSSEQTASPSAMISTSAVRLMHEYTGRGPTRAKTVINDELVTVLLGDTLTKGERKLVAKGMSDRVLQLRHDYQLAMREDLIARGATAQPQGDRLHEPEPHRPRPRRRGLCPRTRSSGLAPRAGNKGKAAKSATLAYPRTDRRVRLPAFSRLATGTGGRACALDRARRGDRLRFAIPLLGAAGRMPMQTEPTDDDLARRSAIKLALRARSALGRRDRWLEQAVTRLRRRGA